MLHDVGKNVMPIAYYLNGGHSMKLNDVTFRIDRNTFSCITQLNHQICCHVTVTLTTNLDGIKEE